MIARDVVWMPVWDPERAGWGIEHLLLRPHRADSVVLGFDDRGSPFRLGYDIEWDDAWHVSRALLSVEAADRHHRLELISDRRGTWTVNDDAAAELSGCIDLDIWPTPFTNTFPIQRLGDGLRSRYEVDVAYIRAPELTVERVRQAYTLLADGLYRFESVADGFTADLPVDEDGIVIDYPGLFRRLR